jgi:uncharacterized Zn finger protein
VEVLRRKAQESVRDAQKKGRDYEPVIPHRGSRQICESWWGQAWCANLEQYADYASRLERGRRYFRSGTVVDLKIRGGRVEARVQGSRKVPYKVDIRISPLSEEKCQEIIARCGRKIQTIDKLINGEFPDELRDLFTGENGLFPSPREISFNCSCPDWALMCKHVAAAMYGIGVRFDENPFYFFHLRGIDVDRFIDVALENKVESMLRNAEQPSERILRETDLTGLFGVL